MKARYGILRRAAGEALKISQTEYMEIVSGGVCSYCGDDIGSTSGHSLDRVDSSAGYSVENVVVCCKYCNMFKNNLLTSREMKRIITLLKTLRKNKRPLWAKQGGKK